MKTIIITTIISVITITLAAIVAATAGLRKKTVTDTVTKKTVLSDERIVDKFTTDLWKEGKVVLTAAQVPSKDTILGMAGQQIMACYFSHTCCNPEFITREDKQGRAWGLVVVPRLH